MCTSNQDPVSKIAVPTIGKDTISGNDVLTNRFIIIEFHDDDDGVATCVGDEANKTRHFHLLDDDYQDMKIAIAAGLKIQLRGREGPRYHYTRVNWEGVVS